MKKATSGQDVAGTKQRAAAKTIITGRALCPNAPDCRRWTVDNATETATCGHCAQTLSRADLARLLEGAA